MGMNYYARILPSEEKKHSLIKAIEQNDFRAVDILAGEMYSKVSLEFGTHEFIGGVVHLGKASYGWKFCWDPNIFIVHNGHVETIDIDDGHKTAHWVDEPSTTKYLYPLNKKGIKEFIDRPDILIYDEEDEIQDKESFWTMALNWGRQEDSKSWDAASYEEWEISQGKSHRLYPITGEYTDMLIKEGYKFTSKTNSDFYSDGLRFAGFTDFS